MARAQDTDPARGDTLRVIAIASAAVYTIFTVVVAFGGTDASYQGPLWASWGAVMLVAIGTFAIGAAIHRGTKASVPGTADQEPVLTPVS